MAIDFDFNKYCLPTSTETPNFLACSNPKMEISVERPNKTTIHGFNWPHICKDLQKGPSLIKVNLIQNGNMDIDYFKALIEQNPYARPSEIKKLADIDKKYYKERTLDQMIVNFRKIAFPKEENEILNNVFCQTIDQEIGEKLSFFQRKGEIVDPNNTNKVNKYVIFGTKFSLRILARASRWFIDGIFKVVPINYKQIYIFISKYENYTVPCLFLLLTSKKEVLYNAAFSHIKVLCKGYNYNIETKSVMLDYEIAPRNAIKFNFEQIKPKDDFFSFHTMFM